MLLSVMWQPGWEGSLGENEQRGQRENRKLNNYYVMLLKKNEINFFKFEYLNIALVKIITK